MRVLLVGQNLWPRGGSDRVLLDQMRLLEAEGIKVAPFVAKSDLNNDNKWSDYFVEAADFENPGLTDVFKYIYNKNAREKFKLLLRDFKPDIIHLHIYYGKITSSILDIINDSGLPVVNTLHEYKTVCPAYTMRRNNKICYSCKGFNYFNCIRYNCKGSFVRSFLSTFEAYISKANGSISNIDKFIAVSDFQRRVLEEMGLPSTKICRIYNPIITDDSDKMKAEAPIFGDYYLYYGRLEEEKGVDVAIKAMASLPNQSLFIVGDGSYQATLKNLAIELGLSNVFFKGYKTGKDLINLIKNCRAVIVPSNALETFGLTAAEAMALKKIVFVTNTGALAEVLGSDAEPFIFEKGDYSSLSDKLVQFESNLESYISTCNNNYQRVIDNFSEKAHVDGLLELYNSILINKSRR